MPGINTAELGSVLKTVYEQEVVEGVNNMNPIRDFITTEKSGYVGKEIRSAAHTSRNNSPAFVGEDSPFPEAGRQGYVTLDVRQRQMIGRIRMTKESILDSARSRGSFINAQREEMSRLIDDFSRADEYALVQDGRGVLAHIDDADPDGDTTLTLDNPGGITSDNFGNRFIPVGIYVCAVDPATGQVRTVTTGKAARKVTAVSADGTGITLASTCPSNWANNDWLVRAYNDNPDSNTPTSFEKAWWGIMALIDDGTYRESYFGINRSQVAHAESYVNSNVAALSDEKLQQISDVMEQRMGGQTTDLIMHHSVRRAVTKLADTYRRYVGAATMNPDTGTRNFKQDKTTWGGVPITVIRDFPLNTIVFLDKPNCGWKQYTSVPGEWVNDDGQTLVRVGTGADARLAFEAWYYIRKQYFMQKPAKCARGDGVTATAIVTRPVGH